MLVLIVLLAQALPPQGNLPGQQEHKTAPSTGATCWWVGSTWTCKDGSKCWWVGRVWTCK